MNLELFLEYETTAFYRHQIFGHLRNNLPTVIWH